MVRKVKGLGPGRTHIKLFNRIIVYDCSYSNIQKALSSRQYDQNWVVKQPCSSDCYLHICNYLGLQPTRLHRLRIKACLQRNVRARHPSSESDKTSRPKDEPCTERDYTSRLTVPTQSECDKTSHPEDEPFTERDYTSPLTVTTQSECDKTSHTEDEPFTERDYTSRLTVPTQSECDKTNHTADEPFTERDYTSRLTVPTQSECDKTSHPEDEPFTERDYTSPLTVTTQSECDKTSHTEDEPFTERDYTSRLTVPTQSECDKTSHPEDEPFTERDYTSPLTVTTQSECDKTSHTEDEPFTEHDYTSPLTVTTSRESSCAADVPSIKGVFDSSETAVLEIGGIKTSLRTVKPSSSKSDSIAAHTTTDKCGGQFCESTRSVNDPPSSPEVVVDRKDSTQDQGCRATPTKSKTDESESSLHSPKKAESHNQIVLHYVGTVPIDAGVWSSIWKRETKALLHRGYGGGLASCFNKLVPDCVLTVDRKYQRPCVNGSVITIYAHCSHETCKKYKLVLSISANNDNAPDLSIFAEPKPTVHGLKPVTRYLNGPGRIEAYKSLKTVKGSMYNQAMTLEAAYDPLKKGNAQGIKSQDVCRKARQVARAENDLHPNPLLDLIAMRESQAADPESQFVHEVSSPLGVKIYSKMRLELLKIARKAANVSNSNNDGLPLYMDATGSVVRKICPFDNRVYYYSIVFQIDDHLVPLTELISSNHDARSLACWLLRFVDYASKEGKVTLSGMHLVTDHSFAELNAIVLALNNMSMFVFLQILHKLVNGQQPKNWCERMKKTLVFPHICCAHFIKIIGGKVYNHYHFKLSVKASKLKNKKENPNEEIRDLEDFKSIFLMKTQLTVLSKQKYRDVRRVLMEVFCLIINTHSYNDIKDIFTFMFRLLLCKVSCKLLSEATQLLTDKVTKAKELGMQTDDVLLDEDDPYIFIDVTSPTVQYSSNPFYLDFKVIFLECANKAKESFSDSSASSSLNKFFNPFLALEFLLQYTHTTPLWSGVLCPDKVRYSNAPIENHFKQVKELYLCGERNVRPNRFIIATNNSVIATHKTVSCNVPKKRLTGRRGRSKQKISDPEKLPEGTPDAPKDVPEMPEKNSSPRLTPDADLNEAATLYDPCSEEVWLKKGQSPLKKKRVSYMIPVSLKENISTDKRRGSSSVDKIPAKKKKSQPRSKPTPKVPVIMDDSGTINKLVDPCVAAGEFECSNKNDPIISDVLGKGTPTLAVNEIHPILSEIHPIPSEIHPIPSEIHPIPSEIHPIPSDSNSSQFITAVPSAHAPVDICGVSRRGAYQSTGSRHGDSCVQGPSITVPRCPSFRSVIASLGEPNVSFESYLSSARLPNHLVRDTEHYAAVRSVIRNESLNYLVSINSVTISDHPHCLYFEDFHNLSDYKRRENTFNYWLTSTIITAVCGTFMQLYGIEKNLVCFVSPDMSSLVFNSSWPADGIFTLPAGAQLLIMPYSLDAGKKLPSGNLSLGSHWCVACADLKQRTFCHFNPYNGFTAEEPILFDRFLNFLQLTQDQSFSSSDWSFPRIPFPKQKDMYNCGVFMLYYVQCLLQNLSASPQIPQQFSPAEYRKLLRFLLISQSHSVYNNCFTCARDFRKEKGRLDTWWVECDICNRSCHIDSRCLNDAAYDPVKLTKEAELHKNITFICYLCKRHAANFSPNLKRQRFEELEQLFRKYLIP